MSSYQSCRVCDETANLEFSIIRTGRNNNREPKFYCSKNCRTYDGRMGNAVLGSLILFIGGVLLVISTAENAVIGIIIIIIGIFQIMKGFSEFKPISENNPGRQRVKRVTWTQKRNRKEERMFSHPSFLIEENKYVFSDILEDDVLKCCYQSARMNDKYCICGRALQYPSET